MRFQHTLITALLATVVALPASAASKPKPKPVAEAAAGIDYSAVCHPGDTPGEVLCETSESFAYCQSLEGRGKMLVEGDEPGKATLVLRCQQAG